MTSFTWTYYKGTILEGKKTNTLNNCIAFTITLVSLIENMQIIAYTEG
jgi:hypothetical protein